MPQSNLNQRVIANKQIEEIKWKSKTYSIYLKENGQVWVEGETEQMKQIETNSKMEDLNSDEYVVKLNKNDLHIAIKRQTVKLDKNAKSTYVLFLRNPLRRHRLTKS